MKYKPTTVILVDMFVKYLTITVCSLGTPPMTPPMTSHKLRLEITSPELHTEIL
ncbi:hypothetical protein HK096_008816, partial [Nowakowskiella sp. JEL0078]